MSPALRSFRLLSLPLLALALLLPLAAGPGATVPSLLSVRGECACAPGSRPQPSVVQVALLVWADSDDTILTQPLTSFNATPPGIGTVLHNPYYAGLTFWQSLMQEQYDMRLPVAGGQSSIRLNITTINMGRLDWKDLDPSSGYPRDTTLHANEATKHGGLWDRLLMRNESSLLGVANASFSFIIPPPLFNELELSPLLNRIEDEQSAVVIHPFLSTVEMFVCDGAAPGVTKTADCLDPQYGRQRLEGARRYNTLLSVLPDLTGDAESTLDLYHVLGIKKIGILWEYPATSSYSYWVQERAKDAAEQLNIQVVYNKQLVLGNDTCPGADNCAPPEHYNSGQNQVWQDGLTSAQIVAGMRAAGVQGVLIIGTTSGAGKWSFGQVIESMQRMEWAPQMVSWIGAFEKTMARFLPNGAKDLKHSTGNIVWVNTLKGPDFKVKQTPNNFALVQSNDTHDAAIIYSDQFDRRFSAQCEQGMCVHPAMPGTAHPFWNGATDGNLVSLIGFQSLQLVAKLLEAAPTDDMAQVVQAAYKLYTTSAFHMMEFDTYGRTKPFPVVVQQYTDHKANYKILSPYNIGEPATFPMPTWKERVFAPKFYAHTSEQIMAACTALSIALLLLLLGLVCLQMREPLIRATTPSFAFFLCGGGCLMLISNFFYTLHATDAHCAANVWTLSLGFTLAFASLFLKTFRIHAIFHGANRLRQVHLSDGSLARWVCACAAVDVVLNAVWQGVAGMPAQLVVVDPERPMYNYMECDYSHPAARAITWLHVSLKAGMLLCGIALTWLVRNAPAKFTDATPLSFAIYNVSFIATFVVPPVSLRLGGREASFLIRAFAIMSVALSTMGLLYGRKLWQIRQMKLRHARTGHKGHGNMLPLDPGFNASVIEEAESPTVLAPGKAVAGTTARVHPVNSSSTTPVANSQPKAAPAPGTPTRGRQLAAKPARLVTTASIYAVQETAGDKPSPPPQPGSSPTSHGHADAATGGVLRSQPSTPVGGRGAHAPATPTGLAGARYAYAEPDAGPEAQQQQAQLLQPEAPMPNQPQVTPN